MEQWTEWANGERDFESEADWTRDREKAADDVALDLEAGLAVRLIERTMTISDWRESAGAGEEFEGAFGGSDTSRSEDYRQETP